MTGTPKEHPFYMLSMELLSASAMTLAAHRCAQIIRENSPSDEGIAGEIEREFGISPKTEYDYPLRQWDVMACVATAFTEKFRIIGTVEFATHQAAHIRACVEYGKELKLGEVIAVRPKPAVEWSVVLIDVDNPTRTKRASSVWATDWERAMKSASKIHKPDIENGFAISVSKTEVKAT